MASDERDDASSAEVWRTRAVCARIGVCRDTIRRWERVGAFPPRRQLGRHSVGWLRSEIEGWLASRPHGSAALPAERARDASRR